MPLEMVIKNETGLSDKCVEMVVSYIRFLQTQERQSPPQVRKKRPPFGPYQGKGWMADNFDAPLEDFKEYME